MRVRDVLKRVPVLLLLLLAACQTDVPSLDSIRDSKLFDRRIKETPRQKVIRECEQECNRYRVECLYCHSTDKIEDIRLPESLSLNAVGQRAQIMRKSPSFGLGRDCAGCHQTKFRLTRSAQKTFGAGGEKFSDTQKELSPEK